MTSDYPGRSRKLFPLARLTISTLRAEVGRGLLAIFKIARRDDTTISDIRQMVQNVRRRLPPRLCIDKKRGQWFIRDGQNFVRTGCARTTLRGLRKS